jgi:hypothetical protein
MMITGDSTPLPNNSEGLVALMNGEYRSAVNSYQVAIRDQKAPEELKLELACSLVGNRELEPAIAILREFQFPDLSSNAKARYLAAEGLIRSHEDRLDEIHYQVVEKDSLKALDYLRKASELIKQSHGPLIHLITLELEEGNYSSARTHSSRLLRDFPLTPQTFLVFGLSRILSTPYRGRLFLLLAGISLFIPYWGPALLGGWSLATMISFLLLRKQSTYLVAFSLVTEVWFLVIYLLRSLFLGFFP